MLIVLGASIVEGVCQFVRSDGAESSVLEVLWPLVAVEGRLKDTGGKDDLSIRWTVVGIDSLNSQSEAFKQWQASSPSILLTWGYISQACLSRLLPRPAQVLCSSSKVLDRTLPK